MRNIAKIDYLIRLGLGKSDDKLTYYRQAVANPVKSVSNPILREYVADLLNDLLDFVFDDPTTWNRLLTVLQKQKNKKNEEEEMADNEIVEDIEGGPDPLKKKLDDQRQQLQKQKDQIRLQLQQKKAQKQIQTMKQKGQQQLAKEDEEILDEISIDEGGKVYDPITKKMVARKGIKVKMGGGVKDITPEDRYKEHLAKKRTDEEINEAKMFPSLDDSADSHHQRMIHSVTQYDRTQEKKSYYNHYALPQYLAAVQKTTDAIKGGMHPSDAINRHFNGSLAARLHKHLGLKPDDAREGGKTNLKEEVVDEVAIAQDKSGRANYWYRQHTNRYQMYLRNGDIAKAEIHRKKAIEFKRRSYDALDNPDKQFS